MTIEAGGYRVEKFEHGVAVFGPIPVDDLLALTKIWEKRGYTLIDAGAGAALGATFAVTSTEGSVAWRKEIDERAARIAEGDRELEWVTGTDTGLSSLVIFRTLATSPAGLGGARAKQGAWRDGSHPHDPADLGRCIRLLDRFPAWRARLGEVAAKHPKGPWPRLIAAWDEIEALYREEEPKKMAPKCYARMKELIGR